MFCQKCGSKIADDAAFCSKCGVSIMRDESREQAPIGTVTVSVVPPTQTLVIPAKTDASEAASAAVIAAENDDDRKLLKILIGKNSDYYLKQFDKIDRGERSFNWCALFFAPILLLYRKQISYFLKLLLPVYALSFVLMLVVSYGVATFNFSLISAAPIFGLIFAAYTIAMSIICGKGFNKHYKTHLNNVIAAKQVETFDERTIKKLRPSAIIPMLFIILYALLTLVLNIAVKSIVVNSLLDDSGNAWGGIQGIETELESENKKADTTGNTYPDKILCGGVPASEIVGFTKDDVRDTFGEPDYWSTQYNYEYPDLGLSFFFDENAANLVYVILDPSVCEANGVTLDKNRDELFSLFGEPGAGDTIGFEDWTESGYTVEYTEWPLYNILFEFSDPKDKAYLITVSRYWDGGNDSECDMSLDDYSTTSADGHLISSGDTVYVKGGGWSLFGSATEAMVKIEMDGSATITWVAVLENMGVNGWQRNEIYPDTNILLDRFNVWSPSMKRNMVFHPPENTSYDQLFFDLNNID